ncbi:MAG: HipA domain-containing protein, partial [Burkholderiales bacterium]|nr:HipA domain-containing protein [Burkholderiales bacterium]
GDAHLKNFGLLYVDADGADATLAPAFDIVNTTCYIPDDGLALTLGGSKGLYQASLYLLDFAAKCRIPKKQATQRVLEIAQAVTETLRELKHLADEVTGLTRAIGTSARRYAKTFGPRSEI